MNIYRKNNLLVFGTLLVLWLSYFIAFKPTMLLRKKLKTLQTQINQQEKIRNEWAGLTKQNQHYIKLLEKHKIAADVSLQNKLLEHINRIAQLNKLTVVAFNPPHSFTETATTFNTYSFKVRGSYTAIIKLLYDLEQLTRFGKVTSVLFEKKKNHKTRRFFLDCDIYIQRIEQ